MTKQDYEDFLQVYDRKIQDGYNYEEMCSFLQAWIEDFIDLADKYFVDSGEYVLDILDDIREDHKTVANYASSLHDDRNQSYDNQPYSVHLTQVYNVLMPSFGDEDVIMNASLCHDLLEDTGITYNDLKTFVGRDVADVVYDVTNELGKNRKERAEKTYPKIAANPLAVIVKVADRIANTTYSKKSGSSMYKKYCSEYPSFRQALYNNFPNHPYNDRIEHLWKVLEECSNQ
jgi:hypothetical protein